MLAGPSNADLVNPGQGALLALTNATAALVAYESESDTFQTVTPRASLSAMALALKALSEYASNEFIKVHRELEDEIRADPTASPRTSGRKPKS